VRGDRESKRAVQRATERAVRRAPLNSMVHE